VKMIMQRKISIIVATDSKSGISKNKQIPWLNEDWSKEDLKRFKSITNDGIIICGRNTYNEIAALRKVNDQILPNRTTYVITSNVDNICAGATTASSISEVIWLHPTSNIFIIGGESLFNAGLEYATTIYVTQVEADYSCDQFFKFDTNLFISNIDASTNKLVSYITYQKKCT
jgi:dihydrofolate reductase